KHGPIQADKTESAANNSLYFLFESFSEPSEKVIQTTMTELAAIFNVHIYSGSFIENDQDQLYNTGLLIAPDGKILLKQQKVHLTGFEADIGMARGSSWEVRKLPAGIIACPVCMDASYFETFHMVSKAGAAIVLMPIANNEAYSEWRALR